MANSRRVKRRRGEVMAKVSEEFEEREKMPFRNFLLQYCQDNPEVLDKLLEDTGRMDKLKEEWKKEGKMELERSAEEVLVLKDETCISDTAYHALRKSLGFKDILPSLNQLRRCRTEWNGTVTQHLSMEKIPLLKGYRVSLRNVIPFILANFPANGNVLQLKLSFDGRICGGRHQVLVGVIPLNTTAKVHSPFSVYPLALFEGKEDLENMKIACSSLIEEISQLTEFGFDNGSINVRIEFFLACDMKSFWCIANDRRFSDILLTLVGV